MLTILIAAIAFLAGVIPTYLISQKNVRKVNATFVAETDYAFGDGFKKGWDDGFEYGRRTENLARITGKPTYGQQ
ncbi:hypothetical protein SEA_LIBERTYBELL_30 [Streptomyces phage LibertyBell]|nr:hypothetical protein SEA_LIBERTYBELL_30 [Streptomyces phage LibertyBell]